MTYQENVTDIKDFYENFLKTLSPEEKKIIKYGSELFLTLKQSQAG